MKAAPFDYVRPDNLEQLYALLADSANDSQVIAGGQTLVPLMAMRLVRPDRLVDISHIDELDGITQQAGALRFGAMTRQAYAEHSSRVAESAPLLHRALPYVGHQQTRRRGTIGGSLCNADPSAEISLVSITLEARMAVAGQRGQRELPASQFLVDAMETSMTDDECLLYVDLPIWNEPAVGVGFYEANARASDFAIVAAATQLSVDADGRCTRISCGVGGASPAPVKATAVETTLLDTQLDDASIDRAVAQVAATLNPTDDIHATAVYRTRVAPGLLARAIKSARDDALNKDNA